MRAAIEVLALSVIGPAGAAFAAAWLCRKLLPGPITDRYALGAALAIGFCCGFWLLPDRPPLVPARHWHWLAYVSAGAAVLGGASLAAGISRGERWLVHALLALACAWMLTPTWKHLQPPPSFWFCLLTVYLFALMTPLSALPDRLLGRLFAGLLAVSAATVAVLIAVGVSLKIGQLALVGAGAAAGCFSATCFGGLNKPTMIRGLIAVFAVLVGGLAFVGAIEPDPKQPVMFLAPAAPLILWLFAVGPLSRMQGKAVVAAQSAAVLLVLVIALACVLLESSAAAQVTLQ